MNVEQIQYIVAVAKHKSLSTASKKLHVTQSGISQSISSLERELGVKIFNRTRGQGAVPTDKGRIILKLAYEVMNKLNQIKETANSFLQSGDELKITSSPGLTPFLIKSLDTYNLEYPNVTLEFIEKSVSSLIEDVRQHKTDIGLIVYSKDWNLNLEGISIDVLYEGKQKVYVSKHSPLAGLCKITPQEILEQRIVTYNGEFMQIFIQDFMNKYKPLKILFRSNNIEAVLQALMESMVITFSPDFILKNYQPVKNGDIVPIDLIHHTPVNLSIGLIRSEDKHLPTYADKYIQILKSEMITC